MSFVYHQKYDRREVEKEMAKLVQKFRKCQQVTRGLAQAGV